MFPDEEDDADGELSLLVSTGAHHSVQDAPVSRPKIDEWCCGTPEVLRVIRHCVVFWFLSGGQGGRREGVVESGRGWVEGSEGGEVQKEEKRAFLVPD